MAAKKIQQKKEALARFLTYMLGCRPDEFGLFPDEQGFIPIKDILKACSEEDGWGFVREASIEELLREPDGPGFEMEDKMLRVHPGQSRLNYGPPERVLPPKLLYHAVRRKGYPVILEQGIKPGGRPLIPLSTTIEAAMRIGKRRDSTPVLLTILASRADEAGIHFFRSQELIYLVDFLPPKYFTGPPLPKEKPTPEKKKPENKVEDVSTPGSFYLDVERMGPEPGHRPERPSKKKKGDIPDWKIAVRKERRRGDK
jgi:putative RNA 2'-phosphotransferase